MGGSRARVEMATHSGKMLVGVICEDGDVRVTNVALCFVVW
jgi:hypothetical protein